MRISAPPIKHPCHYGIDMSTREEMIAHGRTTAEVAAELGCDSLHYLSLEGVYEAVARATRATHCDACFSGEYPLDGTGEANGKYALEEPAGSAALPLVAGVATRAAKAACHPAGTSALIGRTRRGGELDASVDGPPGAASPSASGCPIAVLVSGAGHQPAGAARHGARPRGGDRGGRLQRRGCAGARARPRRAACRRAVFPRAEYPDRPARDRGAGRLAARARRAPGRARRLHGAARRAPSWSASRER